MIKKFSKYYDAIYYDKDYSAECSFIKKILKDHSMSGKKILDMGCGTGTHAILLSKDNFDVTGVDLSNQMITLAKQKVKNSELSINFLQGDMTTINLKQKFDVCISMFSSLCYLTDIPTFKKTLKNICKHLKKDGILIFDFWNGNAVLHDLPNPRTKKVKNDSIIITRLSKPFLNLESQTCSLKYDFTITKNSNILETFSETHTMRYHFMNDLKQYLEESGFTDIFFKSLIPKKKFSKNDLFLKSWYLFAIAKKS